ncbi:MAG: glycosyltransferase family 2 protein [Agathobacter sp.]|uniref:glycosyltransferase family 2 protein n=1 Tax=Agathobacter sp. TaxID=2021311 RepID=UPI0039934255
MESIKSTGKAIDISVVVPCYNEQGALPFYYDKMKEVMALLPELSFEIIIVDDGSTDGTLETAKQLAKSDDRIRYISFSRNFGKEAAMYAGLKNASGKYTAIMDADLQDPPEMLPKMYRVITEEGYDAVGTRRVTRKGEPPVRSFFARKFYKIMSRISKANMVDGARDYRLMNRKYVDALLSLGEYNRFSKGLFGWVGFKVKWLEFENVNRIAGETKWSFGQLFLYSLDGIVAFSNVPLYMASIAGIGSFIAAIAAMIFIIVRRLVFGDPVAGWASTVVIILFIGGIQLLSIGILGLYLSKLYLEAKNRPIYLLDETNIKDAR